jgi:hypothetical protein
MASFLTNQEQRAYSKDVSSRLSTQIGASIENAGHFACLSSPGLLSKLDALHTERTRVNTMGKLTMLSVVYMPDTEFNDYVWTDILACLTSFPALKYLEICVKSRSHQYCHDLAIRPEGFSNANGRPLLQLSRLESLVMCSPYSTIASWMPIYSQMLLMATMATRSSAPSLKHLALPLRGNGIVPLVRMHAQNLVSLRVPRYWSESVPFHEAGPFLRLKYLDVEQILPEQHESMFTACPALQVLRSSGGVFNALRSIMQHASGLLPSLHTLETIGPEEPMSQQEYEANGDAPYFATTPQLRNLYLHKSWKNGLDNCTFHALLKSLPNLETFVVLGDNDQPSSSSWLMSPSDAQEANDSSWVMRSALSASRASSVSNSPPSRLVAFQPFVVKPSLAFLGIRDERYDLLALPLRESHRVSADTIIYARSDIFEEERVARDIRGGLTAYSEMETYRPQFRKRRTDEEWYAHIGQQLVADGLSTFSPCGSCNEKRIGMFDMNIQRSHRRNAAAAAANQ